MPERLDTLLAGTGEPGLPELRAALRDLTGPETVVAQTAALKKCVFRIRLETPHGERQIIVKRLNPVDARRNALVVEQWLPVAGLEGAGPPLVLAAAERAGRWVWHVYDDLGPADLAQFTPAGERGRVAAELVGKLHLSFADHPLLPEIRMEAGDLGVPFFASSVRDFAATLERLRRDGVAREHRGTCERLIARMDALLAELPDRAEALTVLGGPETLLHGDLWATNAFVLDTPDGLRARLIDWDHAGVGPAVYDLSTFLTRLVEADRAPVLAAYRRTLAAGGLVLPTDAELAHAFDTAERGRLANCGLWYAVAAVHGALETVDVDAWFEDLEPVIA